MSFIAQLGVPGVPGIRPLENAFIEGCILVAFVAFFVHLIFAFAVRSDASRRRAAGQPLAFVGPLTWFFAAWIGGVLAVAAYWLMHHSNLRRADERASSS